MESTVDSFQSILGRLRSTYTRPGCRRSRFRSHLSQLPNSCRSGRRSARTGPAIAYWRRPAVVGTAQADQSRRCSACCPRCGTSRSRHRKRCRRRCRANSLSPHSARLRSSRRHSRQSGHSSHPRHQRRSSTNHSTGPTRPLRDARAHRVKSPRSCIVTLHRLRCNSCWR